MMFIKPSSFIKKVVLSPYCSLVFFIIVVVSTVDAFSFAHRDVLFHRDAASTTTTTTKTLRKALHAHAHNQHRHDEEENSRVITAASTRSSGTFEDVLLFVKRIDVNQFDATQAVDRPVLLSNAMSAQQCDDCLDLLMTQAGDFMVQVQQQTYSSRRTSTSFTDDNKMDDSKSSSMTTTKVFQCTLHQAIDVIMTRSNSKQAYLVFCEGLLQETTSPELSNMQVLVTSARERAFKNGKGDYSSNNHDWFTQFPARAQPTDAVIIAGAGATSTLHRDPFEWTGTSLCLEGTKIWRFIEPPPGLHHDGREGGVQSIDQQLNSYRLESIAWHNDNDDDCSDEKAATESMSLSAGWQSDYSLYHSRRHDAIPSARELAELAETDPSHYENLLKELATDMKTLRPCDAAQNLVIHTAIQKPGDLLLIPAHWWHQTYAFEPSVAVASQRCGALDAPRVFDHILRQVSMKKTSGHRQETTILDVPSTASSLLGKPLTSQEAIDELFRIVQQHSTKVG